MISLIEKYIPLILVMGSILIGIIFLIPIIVIIILKKSKHSNIFSKIKGHVFDGRHYSHHKNHYYREKYYDDPVCEEVEYHHKHNKRRHKHFRGHH